MPIISDTGGMSEYQRFGILEGKGHKKRTRGVRHAVLEGYDTLSKRQFDITKYVYCSASARLNRITTLCIELTFYLRLP